MGAPHIIMVSNALGTDAPKQQRGLIVVSPRLLISSPYKFVTMSKPTPSHLDAEPGELHGDTILVSSPLVAPEAKNPSGAASPVTMFFDFPTPSLATATMS